jgi:hypothetical protein
MRLTNDVRQEDADKIANETLEMDISRARVEHHTKPTKIVMMMAPTAVL